MTEAKFRILNTKLDYLIDFLRSQFPTQAGYMHEREKELQECDETVQCWASAGGEKEYNELSARLDAQATKS